MNQKEKVKIQNKKNAEALGLCVFYLWDAFAFLKPETRSLTADF